MYVGAASPDTSGGPDNVSPDVGHGLNNAHRIHTNIINLSDKKLPHSVQSLLTRGLSFIPTQHTEYTRNVLPRDFDNFIDKYISKWMRWIPNKANRILLDTSENMKYVLHECVHIPTFLNLSKQENKALQQLTEDKDIIIAKADKGDYVVVLPTSRYLELAHKHLSD